MRLALKYQIILAPATVLLLMTLLLGFLQYNYWDLSVKRQENRRLGIIFIALAEADLATQRILKLTMRLSSEQLVDLRYLEDMAQLYLHLEQATERVIAIMPLPDGTRALLRQSTADLNPEQGFKPEQFLSALSLLRPQIVSLAEQVQRQRDLMRDIHKDDIDELVARTAFVSIIVLGAAILLGILLSLAFAGRILKRIKLLSESAGRIVRGELTPPPAPTRVRDELDDLALSINHMTDRLIRVVSTEKLLEGAEEERRRIAMDIHDQTLSDLSTLLRRIQDLKQRSGLAEEAGRLEEDLNRAIANLREVMDDLHPQTLDILGLGSALQSHLERYVAREEKLKYHFYCSPEAESTALTRVARLTLYRIAVEAIHNVVKHSGANRFEITLARRGEELSLTVEDNGQGFEPSQAGQGRGLHNIRERAQAIGAAIRWSSSRFSSGTRFEVTLPVPAGLAGG